MSRQGLLNPLNLIRFKIYYRNGFRVFLCSDNILMSNTNLIKEFSLAADAFDLDIHDLEKLTINAMKSAFINYDERLDIIYEIIKPEFAELKKTVQGMT